jgi:hypothetical protein
MVCILSSIDFLLNLLQPYFNPNCSYDQHAAFNFQPMFDQRVDDHSANNGAIQLDTHYINPNHSASTPSIAGTTSTTLLSPLRFDATSAPISTIVSPTSDSQSQGAQTVTSSPKSQNPALDTAPRMTNAHDGLHLAHSASATPTRKLKVATTSVGNVQQIGLNKKSSINYNSKNALGGDRMPSLNIAESISDGSKIQRGAPHGLVSADILGETDDGTDDLFTWTTTMDMATADDKGTDNILGKDKAKFSAPALPNKSRGSGLMM